MVGLNSHYNAEDFKEKAVYDFFRCIDSVRGKKALVIDQMLSGPIGSLATFSALQEHGVENIYWLTRETIEDSQKSVIYIANATLENAQTISGMYFLFRSPHGPNRVDCFNRTVLSQPVLDPISKNNPAYLQRCFCLCKCVPIERGYIPTATK